MNIVSASTIHGNLPVFTNYMVHKDLQPEHNVLGGTVIEHKNPQDISQNKTFTSASVSFSECIISIFSQDMSYLGKVLFFLMLCSDLGSGGYYQNRASARQTPVMPTTSVITLHTTLTKKCTGGRFVQLYWEMARPFYFSLEAATDAAI